MTDPATKPLHLGYSTNVHRGETLAQVYDFLREYTVPIRKRVFGEQRAGLELRLGIGSTRELLDEGARRELRGFLDDSGLELFSVNAFPLLDFHAERVKEQVYKPSWAEEERSRWTSRIAEVVADLVPEGVAASVSTLGGGFRREGHDAATFRAMAERFLDVLETLSALEERGREVVLAVEPEPETTFETARDVVAFVEERLLPAARERWKGRRSPADIEKIVRRLFTVNVDTCHLSVLFEDQVASLRELEAAGLRVGKLHVTNAVALRDPFGSPEAYRELCAMHEPRYFHQVAGADAKRRVIWRELDLDRLPAALERGRSPEVVELRSHFHVPVYLERYGRLATTREETADAVREVLRKGLTRHLVLETYTWPIIAGEGDQRAKLIDGIAEEFDWLLELLERSSGGGTAGRGGPRLT